MPISDRSKSAANQQASSPLQIYGEGTLEVVQIDVDSDDSIARAFELVQSKLPLLQGCALDKSARETFNAMYRTNVSGQHVVTLSFVPLLIRSDDPRLLLLTSGTAHLARFAGEFWPGEVPAAVCPESARHFAPTGYRVSKTALSMLVLAWHWTLREDGVKVRGVSPGELATNRSGDPGLLKKLGAGDPSTRLRILAFAAEWLDAKSPPFPPPGALPQAASGWRAAALPLSPCSKPPVPLPGVDGSFADLDHGPPATNQSKFRAAHFGHIHISSSAGPVRVQVPGEGAEGLGLSVQVRVLVLRCVALCCALLRDSGIIDKFCPQTPQASARPSALYTQRSSNSGSSQRLPSPGPLFPWCHPIPGTDQARANRASHHASEPSQANIARSPPIPSHLSHSVPSRPPIHSLLLLLNHLLSPSQSQSQGSSSPFQSLTCFLSPTVQADCVARFDTTIRRLSVDHLETALRLTAVFLAPPK
ncbi:hypothetical protein CcaCcLH18_00900 [Colletotrichum camelliae]|nr:hypothetical protein CcaCcLH18_00900 [Colletotrichum camelliae]